MKIADEMIDLGSGGLFIGGIEVVDLSNIAQIIEQLEDSDVQEFEIETTPTTTVVV
jgi:hypothetical protein